MEQHPDFRHIGLNFFKCRWCMAVVSGKPTARDTTTDAYALPLLSLPPRCRCQLGGH